MEQMKEKITLSEANETLLITLYCKAAVTRSKTPFLVDEKAIEILDRLAYDFQALKVNRGTILTVTLRAKRLDEYVRQFLDEHPQAMVLHLGCGLDSRCQRIDDRQTLWIDLDMPPVIELRRKFFRESGNYRMIAASVLDWGWMEEAPSRDRPVMIVAEGLSMYLKEAEMMALVRRLKENYPGARLTFDAYSTFTVGRVHRHPSLKETGAAIHWGIDDPQEIETWAPGIELVEEWFFTQSADIRNLRWSDRFLFWMSSKFDVARRAHRVLYFNFAD